MSIEKVLYVAQATATGGREGQAQTSDKRLTVTLSTPKELGGAGGEGTNPEQLFAAGYSCLLYTSPSPRDLSTSRMPSSA